MKQVKKYTGVIVPAITPLDKNYHIDEAAVARLFSLFYDYGIAPFILGTTGEAASLSIAVKQQYILAAQKHKQPGTYLYAGISSNVLEESVELARFAANHAVDVVVATLPSYYALTNRQMINYFLSLANSISLPLFIYNIPATTHMSIPLEVIDELSYHTNIVGIKDSERSDERLMASLELWKNRIDFHYILGWAAKSGDALLNGADGLVPSTGNLYPQVYSDMMAAYLQGDKEKIYAAQKLSDEYGALYQANRTLGESLYALKQMMKEQGICEDYMMPPL